MAAFTILEFFIIEIHFLIIIIIIIQILYFHDLIAFFLFGNKIIGSKLHSLFFFFKWLSIEIKFLGFWFILFLSKIIIFAKQKKFFLHFEFILFFFSNHLHLFMSILYNSLYHINDYKLL